MKLNQSSPGIFWNTTVSYTHLIDDEKALRNAIAHDIRSPLSILRGYQEMLLEFVSAESITTEDVIDILQTGMYQIDRIEHFTENMRKMSHRGV